MSATPIPRSLMLTIFSHLSLSVLDELPPGRIPSKTWLISSKKRHSSWKWLAEQLNELKTQAQFAQAIILCPFIKASESEQFSKVAAVNEIFKEAQAFFETHSLKSGMLHGKLSQKKKQEVTDQLYAGEIDILVTTPVIEVGLDVPAASFITIEGAERFGLASLHQLRGRVGRAGQESYCILIPTPGSKYSKERLQEFCEEDNGLKLAEKDLQRRGGGDLFGTQQSGFGQLRFGDWGNLELIAQAQKMNKNSLKSTLFSFNIDSRIKIQNN